MGRNNKIHTAWTIKQQKTGTNVPTNSKVATHAVQTYLCVLLRCEHGKFQRENFKQLRALLGIICPVRCLYMSQDRQHQKPCNAAQVCPYCNHTTGNATFAPIEVLQRVLLEKQLLAHSVKYKRLCLGTTARTGICATYNIGWGFFCVRVYMSNTSNVIVKRHSRNIPSGKVNFLTGHIPDTRFLALSRFSPGVRSPPCPSTFFQATGKPHTHYSLVALKKNNKHESSQ